MKRSCCFYHRIRGILYRIFLSVCRIFISVSFRQFSSSTFRLYCIYFRYVYSCKYKQSNFSSHRVILRSRKSFVFFLHTKHLHKLWECRCEFNARKIMEKYFYNSFAIIKVILRYSPLCAWITVVVNWAVTTDFTCNDSDGTLQVCKIIAFPIFSSTVSLPSSG